MLVSSPTTSTSRSCNRASSANALSLPPLQLRTTDFRTRRPGPSGKLLQRLSTRRSPGRAWYRVFGSPSLIHPELGEYPLSPFVEDLVECRDHNEGQQR